MKNAYVFVITTVISLFSTHYAGAQQSPLPQLDRVFLDTAYINNYYRRYYIIRLYESTKYTSFKLIDAPHGSNIIYKPNDHNNLGIGFTYKFFGLNLGFAFPFMNYSKNKYGTTHYLDLQTHVYLHRYALDLYGQFYKGYYLANPSDVLNSAAAINEYSLRPDISTSNVGLCFQYMFNYRKFSYRSVYVQNEYQKKSAGSPIAGITAYHINIKGDSSLIPNGIKDPSFFNSYLFNANAITAISVNGGYAYTYVLSKHFFIMASLLAGIGIDDNVLSYTLTGTKENKILPELNTTCRFALGYNSDRYYVGAFFTGLITENKAPYAHSWEEVNAGNFRITFARRFRMSRKATRKINKYEKWFWGKAN